MATGATNHSLVAWSLLLWPLRLQGLHTTGCYQVPALLHVWIVLGKLPRSV